MTNERSNAASSRQAGARRGETRPALSEGTTSSEPSSWGLGPLGEPGLQRVDAALRVLYLCLRSGATRADCSARASISTERGTALVLPLSLSRALGKGGPQRQGSRRRARGRPLYGWRPSVCVSICYSFDARDRGSAYPPGPMPFATFLLRLEGGALRTWGSE